MAKLNQQSIEKAKPGSKLKCEIVPGLYIRVGARGPSWCFYRFNQPRAALGPYPLHSIESAREWARGLIGLPRTKWPLKYVIEKYTAKAIQKSNRAPHHVEYLLGLGCADWMDRDLAEITKAAVNERHDSIANARGKVAAHTFVKALRTVFNFADNNLGYSGRNVARGVETVPSTPRQRVITPDELATFMGRVVDPYWHCFFTVLAETGARRGNVCSMAWADVNLETGTWVIPASEFKTKQAHKVHLTPAAVTALRTMPADRPRVFGNLKDPHPEFARYRGDMTFTMHDFRRTLGSRLASKGVNLQTVAAVLGHKDMSTTLRHYTVVDDDAIRAALCAQHN